MDRTTAQAPISLAVTGIILVVIGLVVQELLPRLDSVGSFLAGVGWVAIVVAALWFLINVIRGLTPRV